MKKLISLLVAVTFVLLVGSLGCGSEAEQHYKKGISYGNAGQIEKAIPEYTKAIELNPEYAEAYYHRGHDYWTLAEWTTAGHPNYSPRFDAVECLDRGISDLSRAIELRPDYPEAFYVRGAAYLSKDQYDAAIADYSKVIESEYKDRPPLYGVYGARGAAYLRKGEYDSAISDFSKTLELEPKYVEAYLNRGIAYMRKGEYNSAISDLNKAVELRVETISKYKYLWPKYADCYLYRGQAYQALGLKNEAIADFEKVLELANNPAWIQAAKQGIEELRTQSK
ncbi:MAG: tetratricopeptide repeat protein [Chloroflexota bacterium]